MTNMDRKIKELNEKLGRKTGIDFKGSAKTMASEIYKNKPVFYGMLASNGLFFLTGTGFIASTLIGFGTYYGAKILKEKEGK